MIKLKEQLKSMGIEITESQEKQLLEFALSSNFTENELKDSFNEILNEGLDMSDINLLYKTIQNEIGRKKNGK